MLEVFFIILGNAFHIVRPLYARERFDCIVQQCITTAVNRLFTCRIAMRIIPQSLNDIYDDDADRLQNTPRSDPRGAGAECACVGRRGAYRDDIGPNELQLMSHRSRRMHMPIVTSGEFRNVAIANGVFDARTALSCLADAAVVVDIIVVHPRRRLPRRYWEFRWPLRFVRPATMTSVG